jgi:hypothetical protein
VPLLALCSSACLIEIAEVVPLDQQPPEPGACGLERPAFCEPFDAPAKGGRGGDIDEKRWSVARTVTNVGPNPSQGEFIRWYRPGPDVAPCGRDVPASDPGQGVAVCGEAEASHLETWAGGRQLVSMRARQPFDLAGREAVVAFDVDLAADFGNWFEVWITDAPIPAPHDETIPENGIGFVFDDPFCNPDGRGNRLTAIRVANRSALHEADMAPTSCFALRDGAFSRVELHVSATLIEVFASDGGQPQTLRSVAQALDVALPLTRGYVHFQHVTGGDGNSVARWDNLSFDGPFVPPPRGYDLPDSASEPAADSANIGYGIPSEGQPFTIQGVDPSGAARARLDFSAWNFFSNTKVSYRLNPKSPSEEWIALPNPSGEGLITAVSAELDVARIQAGDARIDLKAEGANGNEDLTVANVGITITAR